MSQLSLYIGEADDVSNRLLNHRQNKDWWEEFIVFISKDSNLIKAHVRYLEKRLRDIAAVNHALIDLRNGSTPTGSKLPEGDVYEMEAYLDNLLFMISQLQLFNMSEINISPDGIELGGDTSDTFELKLKKNRMSSSGEQLKAYLRPLEDGNYLLLKGSYVESIQRDRSK